MKKNEYNKAVCRLIGKHDLFPNGGRLICRRCNKRITLTPHERFMASLRNQLYEKTPILDRLMKLHSDRK